MPLFSVLGSVFMYRFTRADTKDQTIHKSYSMTPKQRKNGAIAEYLEALITGMALIQEDWE